MINFGGSLGITDVVTLLGVITAVVGGLLGTLLGTLG